MKMEFFPFMKKCLKRFNYPQIHILDDTQIADIFSNSNRQFLVSWILKQIDEGYNEILEQTNGEDLGEILCCNGFCTYSEKNMLLNGQGDSHTQFQILNKMFSYLDSLCEARNNDEIKAFSNEEMKVLGDFDTNLFSVYGNRQTLTPTQRQNKIKKYLEEITHLQDLIDIHIPNQEKNAPQLDPKLKNSLSESMRSLEMNLPDFSKQVLEIMKDREETATQKIRFEDDFAKTLEMCNEGAAVVVEFIIKNMIVMLNLTENNNLGTKEFESNNKNSQIMRQMSELCNEVITASEKIVF